MLKDRRHAARKFVCFAVLAAFLYALSTPCSKILMADVDSSMMAALLYLGAGVGMAAIGALRHAVRAIGAALKSRQEALLVARPSPGEASSLRERSLADQGTNEGEEPLSAEDAPYVAAMVALDIVAPLLLMEGLATTSAESTSLLNNFEIVATALIALAVFREPVSRRLWAAIALITVACALLSFDGSFRLSFSTGSLLVMGATVCWGVENNCTAKLSSKDPLQVVVVKGLGSGAGALAVAFVTGCTFPLAELAACALILGFVAYGLSIFFYVHAQRGLGAARTSAYYAVSPFIGVALAWAFFQEPPSTLFLAALALMGIGAYLAAPGKDGA